MKSNYKHPLRLLTSTLVISGMLANSAFAETIYHPMGPQLTFGGMSHRIMTVSDMGNPAHPATMPIPEGDSGLYGGGFSIGLGIEYDGNDNFYQLLDEISNGGSAVPGGDDGSGDSGEDGDTIIPPGLPPIGGELDPEVQAALEELVLEVAAAAVLIGLSVTGINAKAFVSADLPLLISNDALGGAWTFGANTSITTNIAGLNEPIDFDVEVAITELENAYNSTPAPGTSETFDLSGGASVTIFGDGSTKFRFDNNSGVVTKAAQITEISIGYSREVWQREDQKIHVGIRPKYFDVGLSNTAVPLSEIKNAKQIFEALDDSNFQYEQDFSMDIGASWSAKQYQLGATITNLNEPDFRYPERDLTGFIDPAVINFLRQREIYVMERQLKLEGGIITSDGAWGINFGLDANAVPDPMHDDYQWASIGAGFASDSWWLPSGRVGLRRNLAGSQLTYITAGMTLFDILNLDIASTTKTINIDGTTVPQGLIANIGVHVLF